MIAATRAKPAGASAAIRSIRRWPRAAGIKASEPEPAYQESVQNTGFRTTPTSLLTPTPTQASPCTTRTTTARPIRGRNTAAPAWPRRAGRGSSPSANQGRVLAGGTTFNSAGNPTQALTAIYSLPAGDLQRHHRRQQRRLQRRPSLHDEVTGIGTPVANLLVPDLAPTA